MPGELTNSQIALLCDIGERDLASLDAAARRDLEYLASHGFVEAARTGAGQPFKLTAKAAEFLGMRGAGLNEA